MTAADLASELNVAQEIVERQMRALKKLGLAKKMAINSIRITDDGFRKIMNPPEAATDHINNRIEISGGSIGQINQAHTINNPSLFLNQLAEAIENHPDIEPEKKIPWTKALLEMSKHPLLVEAVKQLCS